jgi:type IV pilus assembly protein PilN
MKTIHLNLAAKPYRDYRPVYMTVAVMGLITLVLFGYNVVTGYEYLIETEHTRAEIADLDRETASERERAKALEARIATIDVKALAGRSQFINAQIRERAFSFSALLDDMEQVLPHDVKLRDLNPVIDDKGKVRLTLSCVARKRDGMVEMLDRLYADEAFEHAFPRSERVEDDGTVHFQVDVEYLPGAAEVAR